MVGYKKKITQGVGYNFNRINKYNYKDSIFKQVRLGTLPDQVPRIDQLVWFQENVDRLDSSIVQCLQKDDLSKAYFWIQYALEIYWMFLTNLNSLFLGSMFEINGNIKNNLQRISENFSMNKFDKEDEKWFRINDLIRAIIRVNVQKQAIEVFNTLMTEKNIEIVKIDCKLNAPYITLYLIYSRSIIAEVVIKWGLKPVNLYGNRFLKEILKYADSGQKFRNIILT